MCWAHGGCRWTRSLRGTDWCMECGKSSDETAKGGYRWLRWVAVTYAFKADREHSRLGNQDRTMTVWLATVTRYPMRNGRADDETEFGASAPGAYRAALVSSYSDPYHSAPYTLCVPYLERCRRLSLWVAHSPVAICRGVRCAQVRYPVGRVWAVPGCARDSRACPFELDKALRGGTVGGEFRALRPGRVAAYASRLPYTIPLGSDQGSGV